MSNRSRARPSGLPRALTNKIFERDDYACLKCGHHRNLEVHHILPVYKGGTDVEGNLITLCRSCHKFAPNDSVDFLKYCSSHLSPDFERSIRLFKIFLGLLRQKHPELLTDSSIQAEEAISRFLEEVSRDIWAVFCSDDMNAFAALIQKYQSDPINQAI